ncbi:MAG: glycosyltransferase 87 family protein [Propionibacteriaceae bacterium]|nr:glycosyltransferase 87 family protein [Propionibacteriaceae bacterium]
MEDPHPPVGRRVSLLKTLRSFLGLEGRSFQDVDPHPLLSRSVLSRRLGGVMGQRKAWLSPAWAYILASLSWLVCMTRQIPCHQSLNNTNPDRFSWMCYTDITALYFRAETSLGQVAQVHGGIPYVNAVWEYPVLTGYFATISNFIASLLGADLSSEITTTQAYVNTEIYFSVSAVGLFICWLWLISTMMRIAGDRPFIIYGLALSPLVMTTGLINWDLLVVALTVAGLAAWREGKPVWAGLWWGLGIAAKLYPLVIVGALIVLCVRKGAWKTPVTRNWFLMAGTTVAAWILVNLPMMITNTEGWAYFYTYNYLSRGADLGSIFLATQLVGFPLSNPEFWSRAVMIFGYAALAVVIFLARRTPSAAQIAYLAVGIFVVGNLVYSPQYVLWMLPLLILVRPYRLDMVIFTLSELFYFVLIWRYLAGAHLSLGLGTVPWLYVLAILVRIGVSVWLMYRVVRDVLHREQLPHVSSDPRMGSRTVGWER